VLSFYSRFVKSQKREQQLERLKAKSELPEGSAKRPLSRIEQRQSQEEDDRRKFQASSIFEKQADTKPERPKVIGSGARGRVKKADIVAAEPQVSLCRMVAIC